MCLQANKRWNILELLIIVLQELIASGKKAILVLHLVLWWKVLELLNLYKLLRCGGSLSLR